MSITTGKDDSLTDFNQMQWACRRGRLELDLWLEPLQEAWHTFSDDMKRKAWFLLDASDEELWLVFLEHPNVINFLEQYLLASETDAL